VVTDLLLGLGFHGLTTFNARAVAEETTRLSIVNTHVDIIDWMGTRGYAGDDVVLSAAINHLMAKRTGSADPAEATGILTHHLAHDDDCWAFVEKFGRLTASNPAVAWRQAVDLFPVPS
jgi:enoyl-CoA hydratase/carnithine racemase